jgi:hypothetical protein
MDGLVSRQAMQDIADAIRTKNGSEETYKPSEMADAIRGIEGGGEGFDYAKYGLSKENSDILNATEKENIEYSQSVFKTLKNDWSYKFRNSTKILFIPKEYTPPTIANLAFQSSTVKDTTNIDCSTITGSVSGMFQSLKNKLLLYPSVIRLTKATSADSFLRGSHLAPKDTFTIDTGNYDEVGYGMVMSYFFRDSNIDFKKFEILGNRVTSLESFYDRGLGNSMEEFICMGSENLTKINGLFAYVTNGKNKKIKFGSLAKLTAEFGITTNSGTEVFECDDWKSYNFNLSGLNNLTPLSIRYIIWHALNGENALGFENEGATSRTLKLHATPYASWEEWKTTKPSVEDCEFLGVDETEITKYGELTWEDIALSIKLITIGA